MSVTRYTTKGDTVPLCRDIRSEEITNLKSIDDSFNEKVWPVTLTCLILFIIYFIMIGVEAFLRHKDVSDHEKLLKIVTFANLITFLVFCVLLIVEGALSAELKVAIDPSVNYL